ncbi:MAG: thermostable hemolysin [Micavibrio aeruginosavorus]|uniref:Thermostable hemolysin n=1 Tax=Micavibrio aeruginosavorus TaxID=349221 RepID=A0A7T5R3L1_9BACT|nr:MAG: thermostable hemolysin [Micavibrio aeruginosavorus]
MFLLDYQEDGRHTGQLRMNESRWLSRLRSRPAIVSVHPAFTRDRQFVEDFIVNIYARAYGARIGVHYPVLMSVRDESGKILAALGFRYAAQETLFLEQYLTQPVETVLQVPRHGVTEVGNLASDGGGAALFLFAALSAYLHHKKQTHAVVTGTQFLERRFHDLGLRPQRLAPADPARLLQKGENWGAYYDTDPHVMAGRVDEGYRRLQKVLGARYTETEPRLYSRLHYKVDSR